MNYELLNDFMQMSDEILVSIHLSLNGGVRVVEEVRGEGSRTCELFKISSVCVFKDQITN